MAPNPPLRRARHLVPAGTAPAANLQHSLRPVPLCPANPYSEAELLCPCACSNPFAYVAFKSTEPWLLEYVSLDMVSPGCHSSFPASAFPPDDSAPSGQPASL